MLRGASGRVIHPIHFHTAQLFHLFGVMTACLACDLTGLLTNLGPAPLGSKSPSQHPPKVKVIVGFEPQPDPELGISCDALEPRPGVPNTSVCVDSGLPFRARL